MGRLKPSDALRWSKCAGSVALSEVAPRVFSDSAKTGIAAAKLAEQVLLKERLTTEAYMGEEIISGVFVDRTLAINVQMYINHVQERLDLAQIEDTFKVEQRLPISYIHPQECEGDPDAWAYDNALGTVYVWELKFGYSLVEVEENPQLLCYGAGIFEYLYNRGIMPETFVFGIVQPRGFHREGPFRFWRISTAELRERVVVLAAAGAEALTLGANTKSGSHCRNCPGILTCEASEQACGEALEVIASSEPEELSNLALGRQLILLQDAMATVKNRLAPMETQALECLKKGQLVPGHGVDLGRGSRSWKPDQRSQIIAMGELFGLELDPRELISPAQAENLGLSKEIVATLVNKSAGKPKLTRDDHTMDLARKMLTNG
jgi:hypothetical protein